MKFASKIKNVNGRDLPPSFNLERNNYLLKPCPMNKNMDKKITKCFRYLTFLNKSERKEHMAKHSLWTPPTTPKNATAQFTRGG